MSLLVHLILILPHPPTLATTHFASGPMLENTTVMTPSAIMDSAACGAASLCASYKYAVPMAAALTPTMTPAATVRG